MSGWLLLSDRDTPVGAPLPDRLAAGTLVIELSWPLPTGVLLDWRGAGGQALSLFHHPGSGIGLLWRDGTLLKRMFLPGALRSGGRVARLLFHWNGGDNSWTLRLDDGDETTIGSTCGLNPPALSAPGTGAGLRWAGGDGAMPGAVVRDAGDQPPARCPGSGWPCRCPRSRGYARRPVAPGQWVLTRDAGPVRLRGLRRTQMPSRGSHAAVVLRAPFHARDRDLLVSADQLVGIGGSRPNTCSERMRCWCRPVCWSTAARPWPTTAALPPRGVAGSGRAAPDRRRRLHPDDRASRHGSRPAHPAPARPPGL
ncbi:MAG: hypothetical protein R3D63_13105 [Paracoccaceae bacterium]